jgi:hypothetical protein
MRKIILVSFVLMISLVAVSRAANLDVIGVGAVSMGMGRNGLALSDDVNTIFLNPSGLGGIKTPQITSMYTRSLDEVNYFVAGGVLPAYYGTLGLSYIGSQVNDIPLTALLSDGSLDQDNITFANYSSSVLALSYGLNIGPEEVGLSSGIRLKYFSEDLSRGSASGYDLDFGLRYQPVPWLRLALVQENVLPAAMGASLNWTTGLKEGIPAVTKASVGCLFGENNFEFEAGLEKPTLSAGQPLLLRAGVEWRPAPILAVRAGLDQEPVPGEGGTAPGTVNSFSFGTGFKYAGFSFDYAYRPFAGYSGNNSQFFSISYLGKLDYDPPSVEYKFVDGRVYRGAGLKLGIKLSEKVKALKATLPDGKAVNLDPNQKNKFLLEWDVPADIELGRHTIEIFAQDLDGNKMVKKIEFEVLAREPELTLDRPNDRAMTADETIAVSGSAANGELFLNDEPVTVGSDGRFETTASLNPGINKLIFKLGGESGNEKTKVISVMRILKGEQ